MSNPYKFTISVPKDTVENDKVEYFIFTMACKAAVKANMNLFRDYLKRAFIDEKSRPRDGYFSIVLVCLIFKVQKRLCRFLNPLQRYCFFSNPAIAKCMLYNTFLPFLPEICCKTYNFAPKNYLFSSSMTSKSLIWLPSMTNRNSVCTTCHPCLPAAPGFIVSICQVLSYCTFSIWLCPQTKSRGVSFLNIGNNQGLYLPG